MKFIIEDFYKSRPPRIYTEYAPAIRSERHGLIVAEGEYEMNNNEPFIVASRGRNPENPSDRTAGIHLEQRLEPRLDGTTNTLTSVQKDNYVAIPGENGLRLRKLTPKECWRLMGFDDDCFERAASVNSNTQLYKQAGNSIVVNVLCEIVKRLAVSVDLGINTEAEETEESTEQVFVQLEFPM